MLHFDSTFQRAERGKVSKVAVIKGLGHIRGKFHVNARLGRLNYCVLDGFVYSLYIFAERI